MSRKSQQPAAPADAIKDPQDWVTGDEPMTGAQESYVHTLARQAGEEVTDDMTKAEASEKIDELRDKTGKKPQSKTTSPKSRKPRTRKSA